MRICLLPLAMIAVSCAASPPTPDIPSDVAAAKSVFVQSIAHMERGSYDSLPALLAPDFVFVAEGKRLNRSEFLTLVKAVKATDVHIELPKLATHTSGDLAFLLYDAKQSLKMDGQSMIVMETGSVVMRRVEDKWNIALWVATSPPPVPAK